MRVHDKSESVITFRQHVGSGAYQGVAFDLGIATDHAGDLLGLPVISFDDGRDTTVILELDDLLPMAWLAARGGDEDDG